MGVQQRCTCIDIYICVCTHMYVYVFLNMAWFLGPGSIVAHLSMDDSSRTRAKEKERHGLPEEVRTINEDGSWAKHAAARNVGTHCIQSKPQNCPAVPTGIYQQESRERFLNGSCIFHFNKKPHPKSLSSLFKVVAESLEVLWA